MVLWLALKLGALGMLLRVWQRSFVSFRYDWRFGLYLLLAFNGAVYADLVTGNFAIFEALLLFLGVESVLKGKAIRAAGLFVLDSFVKLVPVVFLGLILRHRKAGSLRIAMYAGLGFALYGAANLALFPNQTMEFWLAVQAFSENRSNNPTLYRFFQDLSSRAPFLDDRLLYVGCAAAILIVSFRTLRKAPKATPALQMLFLWLVLALLLPRFMVYSYVQLIPVGWIVVQRLRGWALVGSLVLLCPVLPQSFLLLSRPAFTAALERAIGLQAGVWGYWASYAAFMIWAVFMARILPASNEAASS